MVSAKTFFILDSGHENKVYYNFNFSTIWKFSLLRATIESSVLLIHLHLIKFKITNDKKK